VLESERCSRLENELTEFIDSGPTGEMRDRHGELSIAACAELLIGSALTRLLTHGDAIEEDSPARQLHKLRIEAKRFRYLLDFFSTVQADRWLATTEAVKRIQDVLGEHQDAVTAQGHLAEYAASIPSDDSGREKLLETAHLMQNESARIAASREQFAMAWSDFKAMVT
jgi:CHAD domain-containing protein